MLLTYDTETVRKNPENGEYEPILDATGKHFLIGCIRKESGKVEFFDKPRAMWNYIIELGKKEAKRGKILNCFAHVAKYDFFNIANLRDKNIKWFCEDPFICGYMGDYTREFPRKDFENWQNYAEDKNIQYKVLEINSETVKIVQKKEIIRFGDTFSLFRMSLKKLGDIIGTPKLDMELHLGKRITDKKMEQVKTYVARDCEIPMEALKFLKGKLSEQGVNLRRICTINQVAVSYLINKLKQSTKNEHLMIKGKKGQITEYVHKTRYAKDIHKAYRGGLVRVWKTGMLDKVNAIDCNSLYPMAICNIDIPDLRTERKVKTPLNIYKLDDLLNKIGISKVMMQNTSNKIGFIPIRTINKNYIPIPGQYFIGVYTNMEIKKAIEEGYRILDIEWSVIYDKGYNTFKDIFKELYRLRIEDDNAFNKVFYKSMMNSSLGKLGQRRKEREYLIDSIEKVEEYKKMNFNVIQGIPNSANMMYLKEFRGKPKKYYCPIIPSLVTAYSRIYMYDMFKKIPYESLVYSDTDSILWQGNKDFIKRYEIGNDMGEFKIEKDSNTQENLLEVPALIWGTKTKAIGSNIAIAGFRRRDITFDDFKKGKVKSKKMIGFKVSGGVDTGKFKEESRDLSTQEENFILSEKLLNSEKLLIDTSIKDISYFIDHINSIKI